MGERAVEAQRPERGRPPEGQERSRWPAGPFIRVYTPEGRRPRPENAVVASVLFYRNGGYTVLWPDRPADHQGRSSPLARPFSVVEVALGRYRSSFAMQLPAAGGAAFFQTEVDVTWEVVDPYLVARNQVRDVADLIEPELKDRLRDVSRRFRITEAAQAYDAIRERMRSGAWEPLGRDIGLETRVYVRVDLNAKAIGRAETTEDDAFEATRVARRMGTFRELIEAGDYAQVAYMMASSPDDATTILQMLKEERRADRREGLDFVRHMIDQGMVEPHHVSEQVRAVIDYVSQTSDRFLGIESKRAGRPRPGGRPQPRALPGPPAGARRAPEPPADGSRSQREPWDDEPEAAAAPPVAAEPWEAEPEAAAAPAVAAEPWEVGSAWPAADDGWRDRDRSSWPDEEPEPEPEPRDRQGAWSDAFDSWADP